MKRIVLLIFIILCTASLQGQMSFEEGTYVRFKTLNHRISGPKNWGNQYSGLYSLRGSEIINLGILSEGVSSSELEIRCRLDGTIAPLNSSSEPLGGDFSIAYYVSEPTLRPSTTYWFYIPPSFDLDYDPASNQSTYAGNPYSDSKYFLVSGGNTNYQPVLIEQEPVDSLSRSMNAKAAWIYDTAMYNLVGTGRRWMGELFDFTTVRSYDFHERTSHLSATQIGAVAGSEIHVQIRAVARASTSNTKLRVEYGSQVAEITFPSIGTGTVSNYVQEKFLNTTFIADASSTLKLTYDKAGNSSAALWLDEMIVDWETPATSPYPSKFYVNDPRGSGNYSHFSSAWNEEMLIFGLENHQIASKVEPAIFVSTGANSWTTTWYSHEDKLRTYIIGSPSKPLQWKVDEVVDLSTVETALMGDLESTQSIIIAPDSLLSAAHALADLQRSTGVSAEVVALSYIYDLMNSGNPDIGALRKFLVRVYNDFGSLAYVTLFGDASYDYKGVLQGTKSNLVPTYEAQSSFSLYTSYITDDYFGYLEAGESLNWFAEDLDIGIGRIPVRNRAQAEAAVAKIERYLKNEDRFGPWRMNAVWVADDVDNEWEKEFEVVQDRLTKELDSTRNELNAIKIYSDAFLQESMPGSQRYPEARQKLFREVEEGSLLVSYVGHGGEVGWATERILQLEDVNSWKNATKLPVFTTITCEFARFDDPNRVSAAEQLHLNPIGGAVALFSTTRSVFATNSTYELNGLLNKNMLFLNEPRLGDVIRTTKNNNISGDKIKFSLLGDPTLPLARPHDGLVFDSINGIAWDQFSDTIKALNWVQIKGSIRDSSGLVNSGLSGKVWLSFYDKKQNVQTKVNDGKGGAYNFTTQNNTVFKGKATLEKGQFTFEFRVPLDINLSVGAPKVSGYATNFEQDWWGSSTEHLIGGIFEGVITDVTGPEVQLFIDDTNFVSGSVSDPNPTALALIHDESGINAVGLGIGHNLTLTLDGSAVNVNDYYESAIDDFTAGTVRYPYYDLPAGVHTLELRAWDVLNQWGYDSITFVVLDAQEPILNQLVAFPNPFVDEVHFQLNHNQSEVIGVLTMEMVNNVGQVLWRWQDEMTLEGASTSLPDFKMSDIQGTHPGAGFYSMRIQFTRSVDGKSAVIQEKLIYIR